MKEKSRIDWKQGDTAVIGIGWDRSGIALSVLGPAIFLKQWWVPVKDPDEVDPTFHKESSLELVKPELLEIYVPFCLRPIVEKEKLPREKHYGIGQLKETEGEIGMWFGPNPILLDMLETPGKDDNSIIIKFHADGTDSILYRWSNLGLCWRRALDQEFYAPEFTSEEENESQM